MNHETSHSLNSQQKIKSNLKVQKLSSRRNSNSSVNKDLNRAETDANNIVNNENIWTMVNLKIEEDIT